MGIWNFLIESGGGISPGVVKGKVESYTDLPDSANINDVWIVLTSKGLWPLWRKKAGLYKWTGVEWKRLGDLNALFNDITFTIFNGDDGSKQIQFDLSQISHNSKHFITWPDRSLNIDDLFDLNGKDGGQLGYGGNNDNDGIELRSTSAIIKGEVGVLDSEFRIRNADLTNKAFKFDSQYVTPGTNPTIIMADNDVDLRDVVQDKDYFYATCTSAEDVGNAVYLLSSGIVKNALADRNNPEKSELVGFIESKSDTTHCKVRIEGVVNFISGLSAGDYYLSQTVEGIIQQTKPTNGLIKKVGVGLDSTDFLIDYSRIAIIRTS